MASFPILPVKIIFKIGLFIEILGWIGSVLIVGAYYLNIRGKLTAGAPAYIWANMIGGFFLWSTLSGMGPILLQQ